jgi:hypothetical protein
LTKFWRARQRPFARIGILASIIRIRYPHFGWRELETEAGEKYAAFHNPTLNLTDHLTRDLRGWRVDRQEIDEPFFCRTERHTHARGAVGAVAHSFWEQWQRQLQEAVSLETWFWEPTPKQFAGATSGGLSSNDREAVTVFTRMLGMLPGPCPPGRTRCWRQQV